ncbi:hypothetical protein OI25_3414 [Paraburkholderia fungorum]|uniref:Holin n=1 Tax=Paraburkholderia fungorum TaxID=134537 RepID=A0AAU8TH90_9BURK|nr:hypothetical protein [Paraburkholderia fungorum]AJZ59930.1 hypothetical protein OI25_3414 [Paraburkholderia fungorum]
MKAKMLKFFHYAMFVAFFVVIALKFFVPVGVDPLLTVLGTIFLLHTFVHGQSVSTDIHAEYDEFHAIAQSLKDKFITALHEFIGVIEVDPHVAAAVPAAAGLAGDVSALLAAGAADVKNVVKDVEADLDKVKPAEQAAQVAPAPAPAPEAAAAPAPAPVADPAPVAPAPATV